MMVTSATLVRNPSLTDSFGRRIDYLRLSVTDRCDLRCTYCMAENPRFLPKPDLLATDELVGIALAFVDSGIRTIRLTGGEPLVRHDIDAIASAIGERLGHGLDALTMTTNGTLLDRHAKALASAGIRRINVSLDTLDPDRFRSITRRGDISDTLRGVDAAAAAGLAIRINMVAMAGINDIDLEPMVDWCEARGFDLALIESMPMGTVDAVRAGCHIGLPQFVAPLLAGGALIPIAHATAGPARYVSLPGRTLRLGLITPISQNFCATCNRIRISADGKVHGCLGHDTAIDLSAAWRQSGATGIAPLIERLMRTKAGRHEFAIGKGLAERGPARHMHATGG